MHKFYPLCFLFGALSCSALAQEESAPSLFEFTPTLDLSVDGLFSSDIKVIQSTIAFEQDIGEWTITGSVGRVDNDVDVTSPPGSGRPDGRREEGADSYSFGFSREVSDDLSLGLSASYSQGFTNHRSLWVAQINTQFENVSDFREPDPESRSISLTADWKITDRNSLDVSLSASRSRIVPLARVRDDIGEILGRPDFLLEPVDEEIDAYTSNIRWGSKVNSFTATQQTLGFALTEDRQLRTQIQSDWAFALTNNLTLRAQVGVAKENPTFDSKYGGVTFVWELGAQWEIDLGYRYYEDTGEINTENFNTAAPGIETTELSIGLQWSHNETSIRISTGIYDTDFEDITNVENLPFFDLYRDREFTTTRLAISHSF